MASSIRQVKPKIEQMKKVMVIVAGGSGSRMNSEVPKQFIELNGLPILMHTLNRFRDYDSNIELILVLPKDQTEYWKELCNTHQFTIDCKLATGGNTRFESVKNGLAMIEDDCLVGVHDGVRPFVSNETLDSCFFVAQLHGAAIPVTDSIESIRMLTEEGSKSVDRQRYKMVQTPQVFRFIKLRDCYNQPYENSFTDDASVYEKAGYKIYLAQGNRENIKITTPMDLLIGEALLSKK